MFAGSVSINDIFDFSHGQNLGKGSYGQVMKARDFKTGTLRAIKVVYKPRIENVTRLKREILIMSDSTRTHRQLPSPQVLSTLPLVA